MAATAGATPPSRCGADDVTLPREKATHRADLPHEFVGDLPDGSCEICTLRAVEPRHLAWEKAQERQEQDSTLPRELGI